MERTYCPLHSSLIHILMTRALTRWCVSSCPADSGGASDGARSGKGAPHSAEALEEEPRWAEFQITPKDARRSDHHACRAAETPGPAAEPHHRTWDASADVTAEEGQGGEEEQEEEEHEKIQAHWWDP